MNTTASRRSRRRAQRRGRPTGAAPQSDLHAMILNRQRRVRVSLAPLEEFLQQVRNVIGLPREAVAVCLVTDAEMARWNRLYRGKKGPTDVLSFPANGSHAKPANHKPSSARKLRSEKVSSENSGVYLGDIAIAPSVARRNARRFARTLDEELRVLILHGVLHLKGYDHETDTGDMDRRERGLRRRFGLS
jgi:probable rRNA maturation factor